MTSENRMHSNVNTATDVLSVIHGNTSQFNTILSEHIKLMDFVFPLVKWSMLP